MPDVAVDDDAQIAELYRMGLLYDGDEQRQRAEALTLNNIHHDEPIYTIRPARRGRKAHGAARGYDGPLPLDLSFAMLTDDDDIARCMTATPFEDAPHRDSHTSPTLRVIYELLSGSSGY